MADIIELIGSRDTRIDGKQSSHEREYKVRGVTDSSGAHALLQATAPVSVKTSQGVELSHVVYNVSQESFDVWACSASYTHKANNEPDGPTETGETQVTFDFSTVSKTITEVRPGTTQARFTGALPAKNHGNSINVTRDGVEGVEIEFPTASLQFEKIVPLTTATLAWIRNVGANVGKVISKPWKGFEAGELLFAQFTGRVREGEDVSVTYAFQHSENTDNLTFRQTDQEEITNVKKPGWHYLWVDYGKEEDAAQNALDIPLAVYVGEVYDTFDPGILGLGN